MTLHWPTRSDAEVEAFCWGGDRGPRSGRMRLRCVRTHGLEPVDHFGPEGQPEPPPPPQWAPVAPWRPAVLSSWESAQQTLYGYLQAPWQQDRANLVAGESAATLWPNLANYFADPALKSEQTFLVGVKMGQLNGPTSFDLGTPKVSALTSTTATVTGCIYDTGTTTAAGQPGPSNLDGGGAGGYQGTWNLVTCIGAPGRSPRSRRPRLSKC